MNATLAAGSQGIPTLFQEACSYRLAEVFSKHNLAPSKFAKGEGTSGWYWASVTFSRKVYRVEIYPTIVVMHQDQEGLYFECYLDSEFETEDALIEGFATRLDRFLSGGPWEGPNEESFTESVRGKLARLFRP